jgi:hypothetical protein
VRRQAPRGCLTLGRSAATRPETRAWLDASRARANSARQRPVYSCGNAMGRSRSRQLAVVSDVRCLADRYLRDGQRRGALRQFARAAVRGQLRDVASGLGVIVRRRVSIRTAASQTGFSDDAWTATAAACLREFADCLEQAEKRGETSTNSHGGRSQDQLRVNLRIPNPGERSL